MTSNSPDDGLDLAPPAPPNIAELSVGEVARAVKRTLEGAFERVRVRGEVARPNYHGSGHLYFTLKDADAALDGVSWRGTVRHLNLRLEEGMEVVCTGRISSYPKSSRYQIVVEAVELAGEGALLKLLEERRRRLEAEGLFAPEGKQSLPYLPEVIGVITSPTGAVIQDILHRLADRFPRHVLLWPVVVQGNAAAGQVADAIKGFNAMAPGGAVPRPDLLMVARGGGSLEDLMAFNEEEVVRATAASEIPLISAVGHETDTTLIDYAADVRAPTPTAAAEMAVPVRDELLAQVLDDGRRQVAALSRLWDERRLHLDGLARGLPEPLRLLEIAMQRLDGESDRMMVARETLFRERGAALEGLAAALRSPAELVRRAARELELHDGRLRHGLTAALRERGGRFEALDAALRLASAVRHCLADAAARLEAEGKLLNSLSYRGVLERGFALVQEIGGRPLFRAADTLPGGAIDIEFADGRRGATLDAEKKKKRRPRKSSGDDEPQGSLL